MNIPENVKIGGLVYNIEFSNDMSSDYSAQIEYENLTIKLRPNMNPQKQKRDFLHELIHGIWAELGYSNHDEKQVDELAGALYALIVNNPDLFSGDGNAEQ